MLTSPRIEALPRAGWDALAAWAFAANRRADGRVRCLHFEHGRSAAELADEMRALPEGEALFLAVPDGAGFAGAIGAEVDPARQRAWLRGPLTADPGDSALQRALIGALLGTLPAVRRFDAFPQADEAPLCAAYAALGFEDRLVNHVLAATPPSPPPAWPARVAEADAAQAAAAGAIHAAAFPEGYLTPAALADSRDDDHRLFVALDGAAVAGYLYLQHDRLENEGYVDFVAVAEPMRGRGHGRALLDSARHWTFVQRGLPKLQLTVRSDRAAALALYRSAGFVEVAAGRHLQLSRPPPSSSA